MAYVTPTLARIGTADQVILGSTTTVDRDRVIVGGWPMVPLPQFPFTSDGILDPSEPIIPA